MTDKTEEIRQQLQDNAVVLYMKGTPESPRCGFSAEAVSILNTLEVPFKGINVLEDPELREAIKRYQDWPTIPQLYVKGDLIGGCDIMQELHHQGKLEKLICDRLGKQV